MTTKQRRKNADIGIISTPVSPVVKAGVGVIVIKDRKVLVGIRKGSHGKGRLAFPGGHIDPTDKSLKACGEREVLEETGITCNVFNPDHYRQDLFTTFDILSEDGSKLYVTTYLVADYLVGGTMQKQGDKEIILPNEPEKCEGWRWVSLDELASMVKTENDKAWIPLNQVIYYLSQMWKDRS